MKPLRKTTLSPGSYMLIILSFSVMSIFLVLMLDMLENEVVCGKT